jgi:uncharacterized membrane protein
VNRPEPKTVSCEVCGKTFPRNDVLPAAMIRPSIAELIQRECPGWRQGCYVCFDDLNRFRTEHVRDILETERGELGRLDAQVLESMKQQDLLARNPDLDFDEQATVGQRLADRVAEFGGSWRFIIAFGVFILLWIAANSVLWLMRPWDVYPFILLNLILSCLAALQAPVIMMSQNRQEAKDRLRAENDYRINLKAELEIRNLHAKMDLLLSHQWQRLLEIQEIQVEMMEELVERGQKTPGGSAESGEPEPL